MSTWLTEAEFRQSGARATGVTINVAFLKEIKEDNIHLTSTLQETLDHFSSVEKVDPKSAVDQLVELQDALETHFAMEEFYGYFQNALLTNPSISPRAEKTRNEHQDLFLQLNRLVDRAEQVLYHECSPPITIHDVIGEFRTFHQALEKHEAAERELMMRLCNEELGVGG
jgi:hypothetical protein